MSRPNRMVRPRLHGLARRCGLVGLAATATVAMSVNPALAAPQEGTILGSSSAGVVTDSYIVTLKASRVEINQAARNLASQFGGTVTHTYRSALRGFAVIMTETRARQLAASPLVESVSHNLAVTVQQTNPPSWGLDRIDQRNLPLDNNYNFPTDAAAVTAYVIDTGINITHTDFGGRARHGRDTFDNDNDSTDCMGHGTHVAGTIGGTSYGVSKRVKLVAVRVVDCGGRGTAATVIAGVDWVTQDAANNKPAVANMSLGFPNPTPTLDAAVERSIASGITYAVIAGNGDVFGNPQDACGVSPARTPNAITVGATQPTDARASFSNFGTCLDLFAPGVDIVSAWIGSDTATRSNSGTSVASPHVAGAAAQILAGNPEFTPAQVVAALLDNATRDKVSDPRAGSPNRLLYVGNG
jgi:subtilisin family serine protease